MKKLKMKLEELRVESFDTQGVSGKVGTVHANEGGNPTGYSVCFGGYPCDTVQVGMTCNQCTFLDECGGPTAFPCSLEPPYVTQCDYSCEFAC